MIYISTGSAAAAAAGWAEKGSKKGSIISKAVC